MERSSRWFDLSIFAAAIVLLLAATQPWIHNLGLEYDEAHFLPLAHKVAYGAEEKLDLPWGITIQHRPIPFVTMPYVGTLDSLLYAVPYRLFGTSPLVSRSTNLFFAILIFGLAYWIARREAGRSAACFALGLLLVDVELVLHLPTGFGPFLIQQLLALAAIAALQQWWRQGGAALFLLATAFLALAFHEKLTFIWILGSLGPAILLFKMKATWQKLKWWYLPAGLLIAVLIVSPILYFAWAVPEVILGFGKASAKAPADWSKLLAERWHGFDLMMRGNWTTEFTVGPPPESLKRGPALMLLFFMGLAAAVFTRQRLALMLYATALGVFVWNLAFPEAGRMHHLLLMAPLWQIGAAVAILRAAAPVQVLGLLMLLWSGYDAARCYRQYAVQASDTGGVNHSSDMTARASEWFAAHPALEPVTTSWGIARTLNILSGGRIDPVEHYFDTLAAPLSTETNQILRELIQKDRQVWLVSSVMPIYEEQWQRVIALAAELKRMPLKVAEFPSRDHRHHISAYRFDQPQVEPGQWVKQSSTEFDLPGNWQVMRLTLTGIADQDSESITVHWLDENGKDCYVDNRHLGWTPLIHSSARFEFTPAYWPKSFRRQRIDEAQPKRVRIEASLVKAKIQTVEIGLP